MELGVSIDGTVQGTNLPKSTNFLNKLFGVQENCTDLYEEVDVCITASISTFFL